jgi:tetratricopeptide (TPR) repeat protein
MLAYLLLSAFYNALRGDYVDKWLFVAVSSTLFHSLVSAVLLTPTSLFFFTILIAVVNSRLMESVQFSRTFTTQLFLPIKVIYLLIPALAITSLASEYYAYKGRVNFDDALLTKSIDLNPGNDRALLNLSQYRIHRDKDVKGSLEVLDQFLTHYPAHIAGLLMKAERHYQLGEWNRAKTTLDKVLGFYPGFKKAKRLEQLVDIKIKQSSH